MSIKFEQFASSYWIYCFKLFIFSVIDILTGNWKFKLIVKGIFTIIPRISLHNKNVANNATSTSTGLGHLFERTFVRLAKKSN